MTVVTNLRNKSFYSLKNNNNTKEVLKNNSQGICHDILLDDSYAD